MCGSVPHMRGDDPDALLCANYPRGRRMRRPYVLDPRLCRHFYASLCPAPGRASWFL